MPFTLAHPAAILPLRHIRPLRTVPLILGALIPDLPYYLPGSLGRFMPGNHTLAGSVTVDLLAAYVALVLIFLLREPLTALLSVRARWLCLAALKSFRERRLEWAWAVPAIVLGVWSHLMWDSFTHSDGWLVRRVAALSAPVTIGPYNGLLCHVLQYVSSAFGLAVMAIWYWRLRVPHVPAAEPGAARSSVGPVLMLVAAAAILIGSVQATEYFDHAHFIYGTLNILLTRTLKWFGLLFLVAGSLVALQHRHDQARGA
jgi:hypothetical protein